MQRGFASFEWILILCLVAVFVLSGLTLYFGYQEDKEWKAFKAQHNCKPVAYSKGGIESAVGPTVTGEGGGVAVMVISRPDRIAWKCDDGVTYWRDE